MDRLLGKFQAVFSEPASGQNHAVFRGVRIDADRVLYRSTAGEESPWSTAVTVGIDADEGTDTTLQQPVQSGDRVHLVTVFPEAACDWRDAAWHMWRAPVGLAARSARPEGPAPTPHAVGRAGAGGLRRRGAPSP